MVRGIIAKLLWIMSNKVKRLKKKFYMCNYRNVEEVALELSIPYSHSKFVTCLMNNLILSKDRFYHDQYS